MLVSKFCCLDLVSGFPQINYFPDGKDHFILKKSTALVESKLIILKGTKPSCEWAKTQALHGSSPVNVDVDLIHTTTHEEHVAALLQTPAEVE